MASGVLIGALLTNCSIYALVVGISLYAMYTRNDSGVAWGKD